jgi:signal transduction histidine kinase
MRWRILTLSILGGTLGLVAETAADGLGDPGQWIPDLLVGWTFVAGGLAGWWRRPGSGTGPLLAATGYAWFLGSFHGGVLGPIALFALHRGPLIHCVLSFPSWRPSSRLDRTTVAAGYVAATVTPVAVSNPATIALGLLVIGAAVRAAFVSAGAARRARVAALPAAVAVGLVLVGESVALLAGIVGDVVLAVDEVALVAVAVWMAAVLLAGRWERAAVTDLVVELREGPSGTLRDALARALGDSSLQIGYWAVPQHAYVDAAGHRVMVPAEGSGRAVTKIDMNGRRVAVLVHDLVVVQDPGLAESIALAVRLAASHANLRAEVRTQVDEVRASRRRLIRVGDQERIRLERRLRDGPERTLDALAATLAAARDAAVRADAAAVLGGIERARQRLQGTQDDLRELARGLHPRAVAEVGLADAIAELAAGSPVPVTMTAIPGDLPPEAAAAAYFVCSEALANVAKHSGAARCSVTVEASAGLLRVEIADDGAGGADDAKGTGLRGLADRVEALGGVFRVASPPGKGTVLAAEIPLSEEHQLDQPER